ncbi:MAG: glycoside hydrolase family 97 catalytic domain-containing protein, partial [Candidatus Marinimicrobia bacterium]|nr:glycoside hydrolase family 97 catalytic domain-containing protein [Candidatus Neomarinimicrobiota bacterium]
MKATKMNLLGFVLILFFMTNSMNLYGKTYEIFSPNENIKVKIQVEDKISYSVFYNSKELITSSSISMKIDRGKILGENPQIKDTEEKSIKKNIYPVIRDKREVIVDNYSERILNFRGKYGLIFRVYDDGVAYRFFTKMKGKVKIISEEATFNFTENHYVYFPIEESFITHSERLYDYLPLSEITAEKMSCLPVLIDDKDGPKIAITEADLIDYPGMYLTGSEDKMQSLYGKFPAYPLQKEQKGDRTEIVTKRADYIALTKGNRTFPWRVIVIAEKDGDLIESDIVYRLAKPLQLKNTAWIRPGKVAWDWWNANNIYGVDFKSGINTETYKYYIDFASQYNIEYIIMDEGWSNTADLFDINPDINMEELLEYAEKKKVGIILWVVWLTLDNQLHEALDMFEKWGVKGIKVDFMQRDDQEMVNYYHKIAKEAAKRYLIIDFHGAFKPTGLRRAYPNVLTREGVKGLEQDKWCDDVTPEYDLTIPFIRMLAGPM